MIYLPLIIALAFAVVCDIADVTLTERGLRKGYAESSTFLVGPRPSTVLLYARDLTELVVFTLPAIVVLLLQNFPLYYGLLAGPVVFGVRHIGGARQWANVLAGKPLPDPNTPKTAWQKFIEW